MKGRLGLVFTLQAGTSVQPSLPQVAALRITSGVAVRLLDYGATITTIEVPGRRGRTPMSRSRAVALGGSLAATAPTL